MAQSRRGTKTAIDVAAFKTHCLDLFNDVAAGRKSRVVLTKRGKAVALLVRLPIKTLARRDPWGALRGTGFITSGVDITDPIEEPWSAERD